MIRLFSKNRWVIGRSFRVFSAVSSPETQTPKVSISKESLIKLRQRTGYSFVNCRKALVKFGENEMDSAEKWLKELARKEGWAKAAKVSGRQTSQGLFGILTENNLGAILELNCETDFVAKSSAFKNLVHEITNALLEHAKTIQKENLPAEENSTTAIDIETDAIQTGQNRSVAEAVAMTIGQLGENIAVARAQLVISHPNVQLHGHSHPKEGHENVEMGRFISVVGLQHLPQNSGFSIKKLGEQLCQHIIGMNPQTLGDETAEQKTETMEQKTDSTEQKTDSTEQKTDSMEQKTDLENDDELNAFSDVNTTHIDEDENRLLKQAFMLNPSQTINDYLNTHGAKVVEFWRFELGRK